MMMNVKQILASLLIAQASGSASWVPRIRNRIKRIQNSLKGMQNKLNGMQNPLKRIPNPFPGKTKAEEFDHMYLEVTPNNNKKCEKRDPFDGLRCAAPKGFWDTRKHHCRRCGSTICKNCSTSMSTEDYTRVQVKTRDDKLVRWCKSCAKKDEYRYPIYSLERYCECPKCKALQSMYGQSTDIGLQNAMRSARSRARARSEGSIASPTPRQQSSVSPMHRNSRSESSNVQKPKKQSEESNDLMKSENIMMQRVIKQETDNYLNDRKGETNQKLLDDMLTAIKALKQRGVPTQMIRWAIRNARDKILRESETTLVVPEWLENYIRYKIHY